MSGKNVLQSRQSETREWGLAKVKVGKNKVRIEFTGPNGGEYKVDRDSLPKVPKLPEGYEDELLVVMNTDKDGVLSFAPKEGRVKARVIDFIRPNNDPANDPEPVLVENKNKPDQKPYKKFTAVWEAVDSKAQGLQWKGAKLQQFLRYRFIENEDGNTMYDGSPDAKNAIHVPYLVEFLTKTDCVDEDIKWPEDGNILPEILRRILKKARIVELIYKDGFISTLLDVDYEEEEDEAPKKSSKPKDVDEDDDDL